MCLKIKLEIPLCNFIEKCKITVTPSLLISLVSPKSLGSENTFILDYNKCRILYLISEKM